MHASVSTLPVAALLALAACTTSAPPPQQPAPVPEKSAAALTQRTLADPALLAYLADKQNLGHAPATAADWDNESLAWAAFYFNPTLDVARAQYATAQTTARYAGQVANPTLSLIPGYDFTHNPGLSPWLPAISLDWLFPNSKKHRLEKTSANATAEAARLSVYTSAWQIRGELRRALTDNAAATRRATALAKQIETQRAIIKLLEQRRELGSISANEVSTARTALLRAESAAADARSQQIAARARVAAAIGIPVSALENIKHPDAPAPRPLDAPALLAARTETLHTRADILAALAKYNAAHAALELEVAKNTPDIHLGPGYQWDQGDSKFTFAFTFELPIFHKPNEAAIAAATAQRAETIAQFTLAQTQVIAAIDAANVAQQAADAQLENAQKLRAETQTQQTRLRQRFANGAADQLELQTGLLDALNTDLVLIDAETSAALAAGQLEDALQIPFSNLQNLALPQTDLKKAKKK